MGNLLSYSGIVTKIHAMQAKLLTDDHFREIAQLRNVAEVVTYLKKLPAYAKAFETVDENTWRCREDPHPVPLQRLLQTVSFLGSGTPTIFKTVSQTL
jgi:V/A-type H+-transporting ATPase subunit C